MKNLRQLFNTGIIISFVLFISVQAKSQTNIKTNIDRDVLFPANSSSEIGGVLGGSINNCINNGVMARDYLLYIKPFAEKLDDGGGFMGEFWGKWFTSAALAYRYQPTAAYRMVLDRSASLLINTQDSDGRLSSYPKTQDFGHWDIWGRKYALLGLIAHYDQTGDKKSLKAACSATDALIGIAGPGKQKLTETGLQIIGSLSSCSILEPVVLVYERSGEKKYLDFALYLVQLWSEPNTYNPKGMRLVEEALTGTHPIHIAAPKGYEMMSCYEGLCELYRVTGDPKLLEAVVKFGKSVLKKEIMIVGSGSSGELWCDGANRQTEILEQPMETCVTVTWMKLCYQLLRLTGDPLWADQLEVSLYNSLLGAITPDGSWWAYFSPLTGERMPSPMQVPVCQSSCCVANGPRGLLLTPEWSVMKSDAGPVINLYSEGKWSQKLKSGNNLTISQETNYPETNEIIIHLDLPKPEHFTLSLRIPEWGKNTSLLVNDEPINCQPGAYAQVKREWKKGDRIRIEMDLRGRIIRAPGSLNHLAVMRGPVVLALDNRMVKDENYNLWLLPRGTQWNFKDELGGLNYVLPSPCITDDSPQQYVDLVPSPSKPENVWMAFEVPFLYRYTHFFDHKQVNLVMCDYASAGNQYSEKNLFRVWLPQPIFMNDVFPENTWRILYREGDTRPEIPCMFE